MSRGLTSQQERLSEIVRRFAQCRIAVVGDAVADPCPEALVWFAVDVGDA